MSGEKKNSGKDLLIRLVDAIEKSHSEISRSQRDIVEIMKGMTKVMKAMHSDIEYVIDSIEEEFIPETDGDTLRYIG